jgi:hypothetical protein
MTEPPDTGVPSLAGAGAGTMRPILRSSCAEAATAAEARFRIDREIGGRSARVVALDDEAAAIVQRVAELPWGASRFLTADAASGDVVLRDLDGTQSPLAEQLADADVSIMIGTAEASAEVAGAIGRASFERGIMTAGLILGDRAEVSEAVSALRPYARVLMVTDDEDDVAAVLTALRA